MNEFIVLELLEHLNEKQRDLNRATWEIINLRAALGLNPYFIEKYDSHE